MPPLHHRHNRTLRPYLPQTYLHKHNQRNPHLNLPSHQEERLKSTPKPSVRNKNTYELSYEPTHPNNKPNNKSTKIP